MTGKKIDYKDIFPESGLCSADLKEVIASLNQIDKYNTLLNSKYNIDVFDKKSLEIFGPI